MNNAKRIIVALCLTVAIARPQAANAQAQAVGPLIQLGAQVASTVIPYVVPMVVGGVVMSVNVTRAIPAYVKERVTVPHLRGKRKVADASTDPTPPGADTDKATKSVTGAVIDESKSPKSDDNKLAAKNDSQSQTTEGDQEREQKPAAPKPPAPPRDASEWYLD